MERMMKNMYKLLFFLLVFASITAAVSDINKKRYVGKIILVNDENIVRAGMARLGYQELEIKISQGRYKNKILRIKNSLLGDMEFDEFYKIKDRVLVSVQEKNGEIINTNLNGHYRCFWIKIMFIIFVLLLIFYSKYTGLRAILSFILTFLIIWKLMIPLFFYGINPILVCVMILMLISSVIIFLVAGFTKKGVSALLGTVSGLMSAVILTFIFGNLMKLFGMTEPFAQSLLFSGNFNLNMQAIFYSGIIIGASGAAMDIAMDIAASMEEVRNKKQDISKKELRKSGFNVGKSVIGTMTTTLLLAYSGSYTTLLMLFYQKGYTLSQILNLKIISAEVMRTLIGSIALVIVAPLTAIFAAHIYTTDYKISKILIFYRAKKRIFFFYFE
jgi:uncharacterized membrane protein